MEFCASSNNRFAFSRELRHMSISFAGKIHGVAVRIAPELAYAQLVAANALKKLSELRPNYLPSESEIMHTPISRISVQN